MTVKPRRPVGGLPGAAQPSEDTATAKKPVGRPERRAVDHCQRAASAPPGGPT